MNAITSFRLCKLPSHELIKKIDKQTDEMFETQKVPIRHTPARRDSDYDLLVGELILRFMELESFIKSVEDDLYLNTYDEEDEDVRTSEDLSQFILNTGRKISKFLATEYGKSVV